MVRLMILGLLKLKELSGYEIQQVLQTSQTDVWAGVLPGSIYHALKKMDKEGLVQVSSVEQTGHRIKAIYKITAQGESEFIKLLKESLREKSVGLPSTLYTAMAFLRELPLKEQLEGLQEQKVVLEKELELLRVGEKAKEQHVTLDAIAKLQFENMFAHYQLQIDFLEKLMQELMLKEQLEIKKEDFDKYFETD
jgi:DNA-binding PadR family transcriptional regulator